MLAEQERATGVREVLAVADCPLSPRQLEIARRVAKGQSYKQAAMEMGIRPSTIASHVRKVYARLGIQGPGGRSALIATMLAAGWVEELLPSFDGTFMARGDQRWVKRWQPSPAQRLYLDAFDRLLRLRDEGAAEELDFYFAVLCREAQARDSRPSGASRQRRSWTTGVRWRPATDVDDMLLRLAAALRRPVPA